MTKSVMIEKLAAIEHGRWADWQKYLHNKCEMLTNGDLVIPASLAVHWMRQIRTPYAELSDHEKASDRDEVGRYWPLLEEEITRARVDELETIRAWVFDENLRGLIDARLKIYDQPEKDRRD